MELAGHTTRAELLSRACVLAKTICLLWFPVWGQGNWFLNLLCFFIFIFLALADEISLNNSLLMLELLWQWWPSIPNRMSLWRLFYTQFATFVLHAVQEQLLMFSNLQYGTLGFFFFLQSSQRATGSDIEPLVRAVSVSPCAWVGMEGFAAHFFGGLWKG